MEASFNNVLMGNSVIHFVTDYTNIEFIFTGIDVNKPVLLLLKNTVKVDMLWKNTFLLLYTINICYQPKNYTVFYVC